VGFLVNGLAIVSPATPAQADIVNPPGACVGTADFHDAAVSLISTDLKPGTVTTIHRSDLVKWSGRVVGPVAGTARAVDGAVQLHLPWPLGALTIGTWHGISSQVERTGVYAYDLPPLVPPNVVFDLEAHHDESGARHCTATTSLKIDGAPFGGPTIWIGLAGLVITATLTLLLGRNPSGQGGPVRTMLGALAGFFFGLFAGVVAILFGVFTLSGPTVAIAAAFGLIGGGLWTRLAPLRGRSPVAPNPTAIP
jgi:hypothetical protein